MAKRKKRAEAEPETGAKNSEKRVTGDQKLDFVNGDSQQSKKKENKKNKKAKESSCVETDEIPTVSIAIAGSVIHNAQSLELATRLAGQIARAATIFRIDEIVVFDNKINSGNDAHVMSLDENESGAAFLVRILRYLETPQYLRKALFPKHNSLRFVGMLPPLDAPHHLRKHEWAPYREGITLREKATNSSATMVDVGLSKNVMVEQELEPGMRVTVAMGKNHNLDSDLPRQVVSSSKLREDAGMYWGYKVRYASNISSVFKGCPYKGGYDHLIGTSEHGLIVSSSQLTIPAFSIEEDDNLKGKNAPEVFDLYLNTCPHQGSRTIRTEEAIFISLQYFREPITRALQRAENQR